VQANLALRAFTDLEKFIVFAAELDSVEVLQHRDGERLSKSPGAANELNVSLVFKHRDIFRLVEVCHSRLANLKKV